MFNDYRITINGQWLHIDLFYTGDKPEQSAALASLQKLFADRCDFTRSAVKWQDENMISISSVRIDGFGGFEK